MRVELAPNTFAVIRENKIDGVEFIEKGKLSLKGEVALIDEIYGDKVPAHYVVRKQDGDWKSLVMPFDLMEDGNFISVTLKDSDGNYIVYPTIREMLSSYIAKYPYGGLSEDDEFYFFSEEPMYEYPEEDWWESFN